MSLRFLTSKPFELGQSLRGTADGTTTGSLINNEILGGAYCFPSYITLSPTNGVRSTYTAEPLTCIAIRNASGVTLYGKRFATLDVATAGVGGITDALGYADTLAEGPCVLIDPHLSSSGVADNDIFWGVVQGVALATTSEVNSNFNGDIAVGAALVAATAASSTGSTTGGRVSNVTFTNATAGNTSNGYDGYRMALNHLGTALSAKTTDNTSADILVRVKVARLL